MDGPGGGGDGQPEDRQQQQREQDNEHRPAADAQQLDVPKPPARRLSRSTMSLKIAPDIPPKPPKFQFFPSSPTPMCLTMPMTPIADPTIPNGFSPQLYQAYTSNKATDFFFKQLDGFKDIVSTAKLRLSFGERAVFWMYDKIREWSRKWLTHFFLLFIAAGYCAAGALVFQAVEGSKDQNLVLREREQLIINVANLMEKIVKKNDSIFIETGNLIRKYESFFVQNNKPEWNYLNAVFYCGTVFTTIDCLIMIIIYQLSILNIQKYLHINFSDRERGLTMKKSDDDDDDNNESCYTDYETDGFWSSEKTLLESVQGKDASGTATTTRRRKKKKKKAKDRGDGKKLNVAGTGMRHQWRCFVQENDDEWRKFWNTGRKCFINTVILVIMCGVGGVVFRYTEGAFESFYKCGVKRVKRDFLDGLWTDSRRMGADQWKQTARRKLVEFEEQLHDAFEAGTTTYSGRSSWSFVNSAIYCFTVVTTIGYGHISPSTNTGRLITIVYAIFGIPIFLILLADFGKMFTRGIKFLWAFVRRLYYTGSCRKVRRTAPVQEVMKGVQMMYDITKFRRPSNMFGAVPDSQSGFPPTSPSTPALSVYTIDDEFNLPVSVAFLMLVVYIVIGAIVFCFEEGWGFFESFYFVFISMSTIGFGDFVPKNQLVMIVSIVYLVFGLALTSMCINVVQEKLQNSFRQATTKISATIGLGLPRVDNNEPAPIVVDDMLTVDADGMTTIDADAVTDNDDD